MGGLDSLSMLAAPQACQWVQAMQMSSDNLAQQVAFSLSLMNVNDSGYVQKLVIALIGLLCKHDLADFFIL